MKKHKKLKIPKDLNLKILNEEEQLWTEMIEKLEMTLKQLKKEITLNTAFLETARQELVNTKQ